MLLAALVAVASALPQAQDPLDALFARAAATKRLRAEFELTRSASPEPVVYTLDYQAPDRMRLETRSADGVTDMWFVGTVLSLRADQGGVGMAFDVDFADIHRELRDLEARARAAAPALVAEWPLRQEQTHPVCQFVWGYDAKTDSGEFRFALGVLAKPEAPFGWLETARRKAVGWTRDGELLRAETDGRFAVTLAPTGLLQELAGRTGKGAMRFALRSATFDQDPPADRFAVPAATAAAGEGKGAEAARAQRRAIEAAFRQSEEFALRPGLFRGWLAAKRAAADATTVASLDDQAKQAGRVILDATLTPRVDACHRAAKQPMDGLVQAFARAAAAAEDERVASLRAQGVEALTKALEQLQPEFVRTFAPFRGEGPAVAEFRALEQGVVEAIFRERVRDVVLARFQAACDEALR